MYHEASFQVGARDVDPFNQCRPSSMMDFLQEAATGAAVELHVSREEMLRSYNVFWMLARIWYRLDTPVFWDDKLTVQTWHRGSGHGASMYRDFDIFRDGKTIGEGISLWVLADVETRKLRRVSDLPEFDGTSGGDRSKSRLLPKLRMPVPLESAGERRLWYSDCDVNGHVNNVHYADYACDAIGLEEVGLGQFVSQVQIGYLKECRAGETIRLSVGRQDDTFYVQGDGVEGKPRFDAALTLSPLDNPHLGA